jgi:molybdenum cofactor synthesis domain-containing protein
VSARAGIVVTGTEVLTGRIADRNGPWIADRLLELGVELAHITICGDRASDIEAQLRFLAGEGVDLIVTSGGLGPTADDMTVATVARFCGRELVLDAELENKIAAILKKLMASIGRRRQHISGGAGVKSEPGADRFHCDAVGLAAKTAQSQVTAITNTARRWMAC